MRLPGPFLFVLTLLASLSANQRAEACTRVVYEGHGSRFYTGRTMDFSMDIPANLWVFPRGMERNGEVGPNSLRWTSRYGSLIASSWDISSPDGLNERGLMANLLWLVESRYPRFDPKGKRPGLAISMWAQYALDNYATVKEAVAALKSEPFVVVSDFIPGTKKFATVHLSLSDASGDSAILEYLNGRLVIYHSRDHRVMTNDPTYAKQLAIAEYWNNIPGKAFLPGSVTAADRFVRASFFLKSLPKSEDVRTAVASVFSVIRNASVPYGFAVEGYPNLSSTQWRVVADHSGLVYYFESVLTPNVFWVDLKKLDFQSGAPVKKLDLSQNQTFAGEASGHFQVAKPFQFIGLPKGR